MTDHIRDHLATMPDDLYVGLLLLASLCVWFVLALAMGGGERDG